MTDLSDLIARLEAATEGSREIDREIATALGWATKRVPAFVPQFWRRPEGGDWFGESDFTPPRFTVSLDDALGLVPDLWSIDLAWCTEMGAVARIYPGPIRENSAGEPTGRGTTPALALCAAILRAKEADRG